jgi:hypothetical protein
MHKVLQAVQATTRQKGLLLLACMMLQQPASSML